MAYILLSETLTVFSRVTSGFSNNFLTIGSAANLININLFTVINSIELIALKGSKLVRAAGGSALLIGKTDKKAKIKLKSGWQISVPLNSLAIIGQVSNSRHKFDIIGKAGKKRSMGFRPIVRGLAKNPCDHPHGGGNGKKSPPRVSVSPWGFFY